MSNHNFSNYPPDASPPQAAPFPRQAPAGSGFFIQHLHTQGKSGLFLAGIILLTAGTGLTLFASFSFFSILPLLLAALPIVGFWLIFAASRKPILPEKTLPALTLFKIHTIFYLAVISLAALVSVGSLVLALVGMSYYGGGPFAAVLFALFLVTAFFVIAIVFYYVAILKIISSTRANIVHNTMNPLRGVMPFSIIAVLMAGFGILTSLVALAFIGVAGHIIDGWIYDLIHNLTLLATPQVTYFGIPNIMWDTVISAISDIVPAFTMTLLFGIFTYAGTILLVISLNRLAGVVKG
jgi:hypothetical protein